MRASPQAESFRAGEGQAFVQAPVLPNGCSAAKTTAPIPQWPTLAELALDTAFHDRLALLSGGHAGLRH